MGYRAEIRCVNVTEKTGSLSFVPQILTLIYEEWLYQNMGKKQHSAEKLSELGSEQPVYRLECIAAKGQLVIGVNLHNKWNRSRRGLLQEILRRENGLFLRDLGEGQRVVFQISERTQ